MALALLLLGIIALPAGLLAVDALWRCCCRRTPEGEERQPLCNPSITGFV